MHPRVPPTSPPSPFGRFWGGAAPGEQRGRGSLTFCGSCDAGFASSLTESRASKSPPASKGEICILRGSTSGDGGPGGTGERRGAPGERPGRVGVKVESGAPRSLQPLAKCRASELGLSASFIYNPTCVVMSSKQPGPSRPPSQ